MSASVDTEAVGIDTGKVTAWLATLGLGERPPLSFRRVGNGFSNLTFLVTDATGRRWIVRRPPLGELLASAHDIAREYRILAALEPTEVPAPRVFGLTEDMASGDVPLLAMEYVDGPVLDRMNVVESLDPRSRRALGLSMASTLARIHAVDLEATGLASLSASRSPYAVRQIRRWRGQWEASKTREQPLVDELGQRLSAAMPEQREATLVHGDFHITNVIVASATGEVAAVLDWELCTLGDPIADLGGLLAYWPQPGDPVGPLLPASILPGFPSRAEIAAEYERHGRRSLAELDFWHVLGLWKIAIIGEGVLRRALDDPRNAAPGGPPSTDQIDDLLTRAAAIANDAGL